MRVAVLASGSKGNCTYIEHHNTKILIDLGVPPAYIQEQLADLGVDLKEVNAIVLTHTHNDHICGLLGFCRYNPIPVYITPGMENEVKCLTTEYEVIDNKEYTINDLIIKTITTSHDCISSVGFIIKANEKELVYITDTGYINFNHFSQLENKDMYILESNHDIEMLMNGKYPYHLKQRILSDTGHLSNKDSSMYLSKFAGSKTKCIVLAHLSEENNTEEIALKTLIDSLNNAHKKIDRIFIARQNERTELIEI